MLLRIGNHLINLLTMAWIEFSDSANSDAGATVHFSDGVVLTLSASDVAILHRALSMLGAISVPRPGTLPDLRHMN